jgi:hypothetical protein
MRQPSRSPRAFSQGVPFTRGLSNNSELGGPANTRKSSDNVSYSARRADDIAEFGGLNPMRSPHSANKAGGSNLATTGRNRQESFDTGSNHNGISNGIRSDNEETFDYLTEIDASASRSSLEGVNPMLSPSASSSHVVASPTSRNSPRLRKENRNFSRSGKLKRSVDPFQQISFVFICNFQDWM